MSINNNILLSEVKSGLFYKVLSQGKIGSYNFILKKEKNKVKIIHFYNQIKFGEIGLNIQEWDNCYYTLTKIEP